MKKCPVLTSDEEAEAFVAEADLTEHDLSDMAPVRFEPKPREASVTVSLPETLVGAVVKEAARVGLSHQDFIRLALERALPGKR